MLTRKKLSLPELSGDWKIDGPRVLAALVRFQEELNNPGALNLTQTAIENCTIDDSTIGATTPSSGVFTTVDATSSTTPYIKSNSTGTATNSFGSLETVNSSSTVGNIRTYSSGVTATAFGYTLANYTLLYNDGASSNGLLIGTIASDPLIFGTNNTERGKFGATGNFILPKDSGKGIQVDLASPTFPYRSVVGGASIRGVGGTDPAYNIYQGGLREYQFAVNDEVMIEFTLPRDYVPGTDIYIQFHWSVKNTTKAGAATNAVTGGSVTWGIEFTAAKGFNQAAFPAPVTATVQQNASTTQYQLMTADLQISAASPSSSQIDSDNLEPVTEILCRMYLSANAMTVSAGSVPAPFLHSVNLVYQSTNLGTKARQGAAFYT